MKKTVLLAESKTPEGELVELYKHDQDYQLRINGLTLMSTRMYHSEQVMAEAAFERLARPNPHVLVGGLGFGFTLKEVLNRLPAEGRVTVAELLPCVLEWNQNPDFPFAAEALRDARTAVHLGDVLELLGKSDKAFDAILLDVDNGAEAFTTGANEKLYVEPGLQAARRALRPGGVVAYWSATANPGFERSLGKAGFRVETLRTRARANKGAVHMIFLGTKPG